MYIFTIGASVSFTQSTYIVDESEEILNIEVLLNFEDNALLERDIIVNVIIDPTVGGISPNFLLAGKSNEKHCQTTTHLSFTTTTKINEVMISHFNKTTLNL